MARRGRGWVPCSSACSLVPRGHLGSPAWILSSEVLTLCCPLCFWGAKEKAAALICSSWKAEKWQVFLFCFVLFSCFLGLHLCPMEVPRLGGKSELQLLAYSTATATQGPNHVCNRHHSSQQRWILNPLSKARDQTRNFMVTSWIHFRWATTGTPVLIFLILLSVRLGCLFKFFLVSRGRPVLLWTSLLELLLLHPIDFVMLCFCYWLSQVLSDVFFDFIINPLVFQEHVV